MSMRILALTNLYPNPLQPHRAAFNRHQFRILNERCPVRVIAPIAWTDERAARRTRDALPPTRQVTTDGLTVDHPRYYFPPRIGRRWYGHCYRWSVGRTVRRVAEEFQPTLLFAPWAYPDGWAAVRLGVELKLPVVVQVHGSDLKLLNQWPARRRRTVEAVTQADGVVAVSRDLAVELGRMKVAPDRMRIIYDGVDRTKFCPQSQAQARQQLRLSAEDRIVLFVGNLVRVKGLDVLFRAIAELKRIGEKVRVVLIGEGPCRASLQLEADRLGITEWVSFQGSVVHSELPPWYQAADVFVLASRSEGVPNVILEAAACGLPWVASRVGGLPEIAHLGDGTLVPPESPDELATAIRLKLHSPSVSNPQYPRERSAAVAELADFLETVTRMKGC